MYLSTITYNLCKNVHIQIQNSNLVHRKNICQCLLQKRTDNKAQNFIDELNCKSSEVKLHYSVF